MTADKQTVRLTDDQQKQIQEATGKKVTTLNIDLMAAEQLSQTDLDSVSGGLRKSAGSTATGSAATGSIYLRFD